MPGWDALNASATCCSTATCSGASPVPRQQYQRMSTSPGLAADPDSGSFVGSADAASEAAAPSDAVADASVDGAAGVVLAVDAAGDGDPDAALQAATMISTTAS